MGGGHNYEKESVEISSNVSEEKSFSNISGVAPKGIFFFESRKRPRRFRRKTCRAQPLGSRSDGGDFLDSSEKVRPIKRSRAQLSGNEVDQAVVGAQGSVNSDPFSLNRIFEQIKNKEQVAVAENSVPSTQVTPPSQVGGFPFDLNNKGGRRVP
ncbi:hypothetical protein Hanom_Chr08g00720231 [Helianthus anomalus]